MKKPVRWSITLLAVTLLSGAVHADGFRPQRLVPLPLAECQRTLEGRFRDHGYDVEAYPLASGQVRLTASRQGERWQITLRPHSVLETEIDAQCTEHGTDNAARLSELWSFLDRRAAETRAVVRSNSPTAPEAIAAFGRAVVCIVSAGGGRTVQLSGFFIDPDGTLLTTAHDLRQSEPLVIRLAGGEIIHGKVVRIEPHKDLALVRTGSTSPDFIGLARSRTELVAGETVCTIGCPGNAPGTFNEGIVAGPPRVADDQPLWQVHMRTLPGSSGSPAFDNAGNLVGVIKGRFRGTEIVGFLIPVSTIMEFLKK